MIINVTMSGTNAQNSTLIEDVFSILEDPANTSDHFFGALVTVSL